LHYIASEVGRTNVDDFFQLRFSHRLTEKGPVFFFEDRTFPNRSENPKQFFVAVAEGIKFSNDAVLKLGLRSPDLLEDRFDPSKIHYGLILTHGKNLAELHYLGGEAARLTLGREVMGSSLSLSYAGEGYYYSRSQAVRLGWEDFHKAIPGLDKGFLRKFGTDAGVTFPVGSSGRLREEEPKMDVSLMYRLGKKTTAGVSTSRHTIGKERPTIEAWIVFNLP
jgi:hypothetical protein